MSGPTTHIRQARSARDPWQKSMEALNQTRGFAGSLLATRDGLCVINACARLRKPEVACAMGAAMLAASETLAAEFGLDRKAVFQVQAGQHTVLGVGATDELLLLCLIEPGADEDEARAHIERTVQVASRGSPW